MIRYIYAEQLTAFPLLRNTMFRDRAEQFKIRLNWDVHVDSDGFERDEYDDLNALYVIWEKSDGTHGGSMRFLPTTGRCMVNEHFCHIIGNTTIVNPKIWECTRFCLSNRTDPGTAAALMLAGGEVMVGFDIRHFVGVFDARMMRVYKRIGALPEVLGSTGEERERISVGLWGFDAGVRERIAEVAKITPSQSEYWFRTALNSSAPSDTIAA